MHLDLSGIKDTSLVGRLLRVPLRLLPSNSCVPILQGPLRGAKWIVGSSNHGCWLGSYEYGKQRLFASLVKAGSVVWDVGANAGFYTILAARLAGESGRVVAFEPLPENLQFLRRHVVLNHLVNVDVLGLAVGERNGRATFKPGSNRSTGSLEAGTDGIPVEVASLDALVAEGRIPSPHLIKIDIEGGETDALRGASRVLTSSKPVILVATHGQTRHQECVAHLRSLGYSVEGIGGLPVHQTDELIATCV